jgi:hypothetical protein
MSIYILQDIQTSFEGDLEINSNGDLKLANSFDTEKALINFWLRTDHSEYSPNPDIGCNLGSYISEKMSKESINNIKFDVIHSLTRDIVSSEDLIVEVAPLTINELIIAVKITGTFLDRNGEELQTSPYLFTYSFPYITGNPTPLVT